MVGSSPRKIDNIIEKLRIAWQWLGFDHDYDPEGIKEAEKCLEDLIDYFENKKKVNPIGKLRGFALQLDHQYPRDPEQTACGSGCQACQFHRLINDLERDGYGDS